MLVPSTPVFDERVIKFLFKIELKQKQSNCHCLHVKYTFLIQLRPTLISHLLTYPSFPIYQSLPCDPIQSRDITQSKLVFHFFSEFFIS